MENNIIQVASLPIIVTIVYFVITLYKQFVEGKSEKFFKVIPIIAASLGVVVGILAYFFSPDIIPADNVFMAILIGGFSGLSATGVNQIFKQLIEKKEDEKDNDK